MTAEVIIDDVRVRAALTSLLDAALDPRPVLMAIGEILTASSKERFLTTTDPAGNPWLLNSVLSTLLYKETETPLTGDPPDGGDLGRYIHYNILGNTGVEIGSTMQYAAMQQFGGTKAEFPNLWGDIPARPFLGMSNDDEEEILEEIHNYLLHAIS